MRDIFLLTDRPIVWSDCKTAILSVFPNAKGGNSMLLIGQSPKTLQIWFDAGENNRLYNRAKAAPTFPQASKNRSHSTILIAPTSNFTENGTFANCSPCCCPYIPRWF